MPNSGNIATLSGNLLTDSGIDLSTKADLVGGLIPSSQLPSYVDDVLEFANLAGFPATGETGKIYVALNTNETYRWSGSAFIRIANGAVQSVNSLTGNVTLTTSNIAEGTNLYYTDARVRAAVSASGSLSYNSSTGVFSYTTPSTDGISEGSTNLYFTNARARAAISVSGSLSYNATTGVISYTQPTNVSAFTNDAAYITTAGARNAISLTTSGTSGAATYNSSTGVLNIPQYQAVLTNPVTGTGTSGQVAYFNGTSTITGESNLFWDAANDRLGIGISPAVRLDVNGVIRATDGVFQIFEASAFRGGLYPYNRVLGSGTDYSINLFSEGELSFSSGGSTTKRVVLNSSGNLGLGVTPSAWRSTNPAFQIGQSGSLASYSSSNITILGNNYFINSSGNETYITNGTATSYWQNVSGDHRWFIAPSGTAGNAISFTQAMTLNASGNLSIGNTNDNFRLEVTGEGRFYQSATSSTAYLRVENNRSRNAAVRLTTTIGDYYVGVGIGADINQFQIFDGNAGATRLTISSTGAATFTGRVTAGSSMLLGEIQSSYSLIETTSGNGIWLRPAGVSSPNGMFLTTGGNVLIGTTSDNSNRLRVNGTGWFDGGLRVGAASGANGNLTVRGTGTGSTSFSFEAANSNGNSRFLVRDDGESTFYNSSDGISMRITSGGNVGIGTTPSSLLHTSGTSNIFKHFTTANNGTWIEFQANSTSVVRPFYVGQDNSAGASFGVGGYAGVLMTSSADPIVIATGSTGRLWVTGGGNIGVGTNNPTGRFHVITSGTGFTPTATGPIGGSQNTRSHFQGPEPGIMLSSDLSPTTGTQTGAQAYQLGLQIGFYGINDIRNQVYFGNGPLTFVYSGNQGGSVSERMRIDTSGNVGISSLAGSGNRIVFVNSSGTLSSMVIGSGLSFDGTTLAATGGASGSIAGSGTSGFVPVFTGGSSIGNSIIQSSAGKIIVVSNTDGQIIEMARSNGAYFWKFGMTSGSVFAIYNNFNTSMLELDPTSGNMTLGSGQNVDIRLGRNANDWGQLRYSGGGVVLQNGWASASGFIRQFISTNVSTTLFGSGVLQHERTSEGLFYQCTVGGNDRIRLSTDGSSNVQFRTGNNVDLRLGVNEDAIVIKNGGNVGINQSTPSGRLHVTTTGITASAPSLGWPVYNAEADANARSIFIDTAGNGNVGTAGQGATVAIQLGGYWDSRVVITPTGNGSASPGDQGQGRGKDLMIKAGTSDNGPGFRGGRLYLNGGIGFQSAFNTNGGDILMQVLTGSGNVGIGITNPAYRLDVTGTFRIQTPNRSFFVTSNAYSISDGTLSSGIGMDGDGLYLGNVASSTGWTIGNPQVTIRPSGNVGIGTTSPGARLDVGGTIRTDTGLTITKSIVAGETTPLHLAYSSSDGSGPAVRFGAGGNGFWDIQPSNNNQSLFFEWSDSVNLLTFRSNGNVGIGTTSPTQRLEVNGTGLFTGTSLSGTGTGVYILDQNIVSLSGSNARDLNIQAQNINLFTGTSYALRGQLNTSGTFTVTGDVVAFGSPSDIAYKTNIKPITGALELVSKLQGVSFAWKEDTDTNKMTGVKDDLGFIAQEVQKVLPDLVRKNDDGHLSLRDKGIIPVLVEAIKELKAELDTLKNK